MGSVRSSRLVPGSLPMDVGYLRSLCSSPFLKTLFILIVLGPHCCTWAFYSCGEQGLLLIVAHGLLIAVSSWCGAQALGIWASVVVAEGLSSWGTWAVFAPWHVESSRTGSNLCLLQWQADSCPLYHQASPPILIWKRKVSSFSWGVVGSSPGETRCYGDFPKTLEEECLRWSLWQRSTLKYLA